MWVKCTSMTDEDKSVFINLDQVISVKPGVRGSIVYSAGEDIRVAERPEQLLNAVSVRNA